MRKIALALWALFCLPTVAVAQGPTGLWFRNANSGQTTVGVSDPLPTGAGFKISSFGTPISVTTSNSTGTLPTGVPVVLATNVGSNTAYCGLGTTATTSSQYIPAGGSFPFIVVGTTQLTCITASSTTTVNMTGGSGNAGSGSGGSGGGGSVTQGTTPWIVAGAGTAGTSATGVVTVQGIASGTALPVSSTTLATAANQTTEIASLASILAAVQGDVPSVTGPLNAATAAATKMLTTGCQYLSSLPTYTNTQQGACTFDVNGRLLVAATIAANQSVNVAQWGATTLGTPTNFGTTPGAVVAASVNAAMFAGTTATQSGSGTSTGALRVELPTNGTGLVNVAQGSAALSATNGGFQNILQGNAVLSATNGTFANVLQGNAALSTSNPSFSTPIPSTASGAALTGNSCGSAASSCVLKASAGNFYGAYAECTSACWLMVFNATSAPSNGATTAGIASGNLVECIDIAAAGSKSVNYPTFPRPFSVGITVAISSTACATLTLSTVGFISGTVM